MVGDTHTHIQFCLCRLVHTCITYSPCSDAFQAVHVSAEACGHGQIISVNFLIMQSFSPNAGAVLTCLIMGSTCQDTYLPYFQASVHVNSSEKQQVCYFHSSDCVLTESSLYCASGVTWHSSCNVLLVQVAFKSCRFQQDVCMFQFDWVVTLRRRGASFHVKCIQVFIESWNKVSDCQVLIALCWCLRCQRAQKTWNIVEIQIQKAKIITWKFFFTVQQQWHNQWIRTNLRIQSIN